jgi:uncharacterized protein YjbI with pentapeptide repeats
LVRETDFIFKGKVLEKKVYFPNLVNDDVKRVDVTEIYQKKIAKKELNSDSEWLDLFNEIKPKVNARFYLEIKKKPNYIPEMTEHWTKLQLLESFKGSAPDTLEVKGGSGAPGEKSIYFINNSPKEGYESGVGGHCNFVSEEMRLTALEDYRREKTKLVEGLKLKPHDANLLREQGEFYLQFDEFDNARWIYFELLAHHPKDMNGVSGLITVRLENKLPKYYRFQHDDELSNNLYKQALIDYQKVLKIDRHNAQARHGEALALLKLGRSKEVDLSIRDFGGYEFDNAEDKDFFAGRQLRGANFKDAVLNEMNFSGSDLRQADFSGASISHCDFSGAKLNHALFRMLREADGTKFHGAKLQGASFKQSGIHDAEFDNANLDKADFSGAWINGSIFKDASLNGTIFRNLIGAHSAVFTGAKIMHTDFNKANLQNANFDGTNVHNVDVRDFNFSSISDIDIIAGGPPCQPFS